MALHDPTKPSVLERYAGATQTSDLTVSKIHEGLCDADILLAAAYAAHSDSIGLQALKINRMLVTGDYSGLKDSVDHAYGWVRSAQMGRKAVLPHATSKATYEVVNVTMRWWLRGVCPACDGRRLSLVYPGAQVTSAKDCKVCDGAGKVSLDKLAGPHWAAARWLAAELDRLLEKIERDMQAALTRRERGPWTKP